MARSFSSRGRAPVFKRVVWRRPRMGRSTNPHLSPILFWAVVLVAVFLQLSTIGRIIALPVSYVLIAIHEVSHLVAAFLVGGQIIDFQILPNLSGIARSRRDSDLDTILISGAGLLGPVIISAFMTICVRLRASELALILLGLTLISTSIAWGGDLFTKVSCTTLGTILILIGLIANNWLRSVLATFITASLATGALKALDYGFVEQATINGQTYISDTGKIALLTSSSAALWATLIIALSVLILYLAYALSSPSWRRRR